MRISTVLSAAVLTAALATPAHASDPVYNWSGLYVGGHVGHGWGSVDGEHLYKGGAAGFDETAKDVDINGWLGGGQVGINLQNGSVVFGIEGDLSWAGIDGNHSDTTQTFRSDESYAHRIHKSWGFDLDHVGTIRGRIGYLMTPRLLIYATGGFAWGDISSSLTTRREGITDGIDYTSGRGKWDDTLTGYTVGGGGEWKLSSAWSMKVEYQYINLGDADISYSGPIYDEAGVAVDDFDGTETFKSDVDLHTIRVGVNYKFGN